MSELIEINEDNCVLDEDELCEICFGLGRIIGLIGVYYSSSLVKTIKRHRKIVDKVTKLNDMVKQAQRERKTFGGEGMNELIYKILNYGDVVKRVSENIIENLINRDLLPHDEECGKKVVDTIIYSFDQYIASQQYEKEIMQYEKEIMQ